MIKAKARRAHEDFLKALEVQTENHGLGAIEFLSSELEALSALFDKNNLAIDIKGNWVMQNMSYAVEMSVNLADREATLLRLLLTPLKLSEVQMVAEHGMYNGLEIPRSHKTYKKLDESQGIEKLHKAVRDHIELAVPSNALEMVKAIMHAPDTVDIAEGHIEDKYGQAVPKDNKDGKKPYDPRLAYRHALYYQEEQNSGEYAKVPHADDNVRARSFSR